MKYNAFISYRRENGFLMAQIIHDKLAEKGITSFLDLEELRSGKFNEKLYEAIGNSNNFILILPKGALDRCTSSEDWVRKEIIAAIEMKKTVIPILCYGFEWPRDKYKDMPDEVCSLENYNAVKSTQDYLSAMIERLISFMDGVESTVVLKSGIKEDTEFISTEEYFEKGLRNAESIDTVDMAFHGGAEWFSSIEKNDLLYNLAETGVHIRVLLNPAIVSEQLAKHMRHKRKKYMSFEECIKKWYEFGQEFSETVEIRLVDIPLLRRYYSLHMKDINLDSVNVKYYTYANSKPDRNYQPIFYSESDYFRLYREEFDYLWNRAEMYDCAQEE